MFHLGGRQEDVIFSRALKLGGCFIKQGASFRRVYALDFASVEFCNENPFELFIRSFDFFLLILIVLKNEKRKTKTKTKTKAHLYKRR